ncbi:hypothetical protein ACQ4LE_006320 [Meloidogyne hapla]|uniref:Archease domain-containing protein n=1 Tax=Meloidogyne hapla TaxID=6305 RepID=A0A1I8BTX6_MELHA
MTEENKLNENEIAPVGAPVHYAYLDHTADVQLHAWGDSLEEAVQQLVISLYGYMTLDISSVQPTYSMDFTASGHDLFSLLYNILDTCLYNFSTEPFFIGSSARVLDLNRHFSSGIEEFSIHLRVWGESFDLKRHPPGTEVKAITYSNMQIIVAGQRLQQNEEESQKVLNEGKNNKTEIFVIIDI